jgi:5'-AMP-activated protein kinase regulatory beta subunit
MGNYSSKDVDGDGLTTHSDAIPSRAVQPRQAPMLQGAEQYAGAQGMAGGGGGDGTGGASDDADNIVPTVFKWEHGGRNVYITGTFNNWERQIPMHRSGNDFSYVHNLQRGKHAFKFVVDDEWRYAPDQPTVADIEGRINNFIDVSEFTPYTGDDNFFEKSKERKVPVEEFRQNIPDLDEYTKEPPSLPPHLRHIILNREAPTADPLALPVPQHVTLNHLYCTAIKDGMMVLGATQRIRDKSITVVFYSVMT